MAAYKDLLVRDAPEDDGSTIPYTGGIIWGSPDILPAGPSPIHDPQIYFSENYNQPYYNDISSGSYNVIYVRVKNLSDRPTTGRVALYYIESNILNLPWMWVGHRIPNLNDTDIGTFGKEKPVQRGEIRVVDSPFLWKAPPPPTNYHYCLMAQVGTDTHPNEIPVSTDPLDYDSYIRQEGGACWRNVRVIGNLPNTPQQQLLHMANPYSYPEGNVYAIALRYTDVPAGSRITMTSPTSGPNPPIDVDQLIKEHTSGILSCLAVLPPNFQGELLITLTLNSSAPKARITIGNWLAATPVPLKERITSAQCTTTAQELGVTSERLNLKPTDLMVLLGDFTMVVNPGS